MRTYKRTSALSCFNAKAYLLDSNAVCKRSSRSPGS